MLLLLGIFDAGFGAFAQIVADCLVRQGVPGPCLGITNSKKVRNKGIVMESEDVPELIVENDNYVLQSKNLYFISKVFQFVLKKL